MVWIREPGYLSFRSGSGVLWLARRIVLAVAETEGSTDDLGSRENDY